MNTSRSEEEEEEGEEEVHAAIIVDQWSARTPAGCVIA